MIVRALAGDGDAKPGGITLSGPPVRPEVYPHATSASNRAGALAPLRQGATKSVVLHAPRTVRLATTIQKIAKHNVSPPPAKPNKLSPVTRASASVARV